MYYKSNYFDFKNKFFFLWSLTSQTYLKYLKPNYDVIIINYEAQANK